MNHDTVTYKKLLLSVVLISFLLSVLCALVLQPLYIGAITNVVYAVTWWPTVMALLIDITEIAIYILCYPLIIYAFYRFTPKRGVLTAVAFLLVTLVRYLINLILSGIQNGAVSGDDLTSVIVYTLFEGIQLLFVCLFANGTIKRFHRHMADVEHSHVRLGLPVPTAREQVFPFPSLLSMTNPLQNIALKCGVLLSATKILTRIVYDIQAGAPTSLSDLLWMITYYASDLLIGVIFYALSLLLFSAYDRREQKLSAK